MLRRAENVYVTHKKGLFTGKGYLSLVVGKQVYQVGTKKVHRTEVDQRKAATATFPEFWARVGERSYYEFQGKFYWDNDDLTPQQVHALLVTRGQAQARRVERAEAMVAMGGQREPTVRGHIADDVKQYVWMRDGGRCRHCGATTELQYDHIIPVAMGGSSEAENLQILCGPCNRRKAAGLTIRSHEPEAAAAHAGSQVAAKLSQGATALPPAGWFPNPGGEGLRYWDGGSWTEHVHV